MKIIGLIGHIGSGKDTVATKLYERGCIKDSFAAPLKDLAAAVFGWPRHLLEGDTQESRVFRETPDMFWSRKLGIPKFTPRYALQYVGTDVFRNHFHENIWLNSMEYRLAKQTHTSNVLVVSDARFRNELNMIREAGGQVVWVRRGELPEWYETAMLANQGDALCKKIMETRYKNVHQSEWDWAGYEVDKIIYNNGTLEDLDREADLLLL
jgi:hypothetical protein